MWRIVLVHWNADEAEAKLGRLRAAGHDVSCHTDAKANPRCLRDDPPDVFVIDLGRLPAQGRELGGWLRRQAATRWIPLVFVEGDPEKTQRVRDLLPDATYTTWDGIEDGIEAAMMSPPGTPVVPGAMDAYRGVPLTKKLGISERSSIALLGAPSGFETELGTLPDGVSFGRDDCDTADVILWFVTSVADLERDFGVAASRMRSGGRLWIAWPKAASSVASDLKQPVVRAFGLDRGLVDYKIASIDETWSALCFTRQKIG
jgi:CheY-like chemotaxis protein